MLPRSNRLPSHTRLGKTNRYISPFFTMRSTTNEGVSPRFAVIVGKKVDKRAVVRNRIRRQFQGIFLEQVSKIKANVDILCIAASMSKDATSEELMKEFIKSLKQLELLS